MRHVTYPNAPIIEAIFDVQVELPENVGIAQLDAFCGEIARAYPEKKERRRFEGKFEVKQGQAATAESIDLGLDGFLSWSADRKQVVQARLNGLSFSRLKPYESWDQHFSEFLKNLRLYFQEIAPLRIRRAATRFVNVIEIPLEDIEWHKYFSDAPKSPFRDALIVNFFNRLELKLLKSNATAVITRTIVQSNNPAVKSVVLDIEVFVDMSSEADIEMVAKVFKNLRGQKNKIFEKILTKRAKELFL
jgi:uncharacterized protein (TIGR04255 family)